jgi:hypothetical protein
MKSISLGTFQLGLRLVKLYAVEDECNGSVKILPKDGEIPKIFVGMDCPWDVSLAVLLHEAYELTLIDLNTRYNNAPSFANSSSDYLFFMTHNQLGEAHERVGTFLEEAYSVFKAAYDKFQTKKKKQKAKKK